MSSLQHTFKEDELGQLAADVKTAFSDVITPMVNTLAASGEASAGDRSAVLRSVRDGLVDVILTLPEDLDVGRSLGSHGERFSERNLRINVPK